MLKPLAFFLCLIPFGHIVFQVYRLQTGGAHLLGADPGKAIVLFQGEWAIHLLLATLLVSPLRVLTGWNAILRIRRMLGLFTFFYASTHLLAYLTLLLELDFANLWSDIQKRPYITAGFAAYLLLAPLALTSTDGMMRRLRRRWAMLHRAVYAIAVLAVVHVAWLAKSSYAEAFAYGAIVAVLLGARLLGPRLGLVRKALATRA